MRLEGIVFGNGAQAAKKPSNITGSAKLPFGLEMPKISRPQKRKAATSFRSSNTKGTDSEVEVLAKAVTKTTTKTPAADSDDESEWEELPEPAKEDYLKTKSLMLAAKDDQELAAMDDRTPQQRVSGGSGGSSSSKTVSTNNNAAVSSFFCNPTDLGLSGYRKALSNRTICIACNCKIPRDSLKFEYSFATKKPFRCLHPQCVDYVTEAHRPQSLKWLQASVDNDRGTFDEVAKQELRNAIITLSI